MSKLKPFPFLDEHFIKEKSFQFKSEGHEYFIEGNKVASVTEVLKSVGFIDDTYYTQEGKDRGTAVHLTCEYWVKGVLDESSIHPEILPYFEAFVRWFDENVEDVYLVERSLFDPLLHIGGTVDYLFKLKHSNALTVFDLKSGSIEFWAAYQTAGYQEMIRQLTTKKLNLNRMVLRVTNQGKYFPKSFDDPNDYGILSSAVACHYAKQNGR